jgi:phosphoenolpyruvate---glycerone phosphotransferase subunit DhaL
VPVTRDTVLDWMQRYGAKVKQQREELVRLDTAIGDGDHGTNMDRGMTNALERLGADEQPDAGAVLKTVAMALVSKVGGAAGPLYGTLFLRMAAGLEGQAEIDLAGYAAAWRRGLEGVEARGKAEAGDKTMFDALAPACDAYDAVVADGAGLAAALAAAAQAAEAGRDATIPLLARKGRASYLGERSVGHQDPGATSTALLIGAAVRAVG